MDTAMHADILAALMKHGWTRSGFPKNPDVLHLNKELKAIAKGAAFVLVHINPALPFIISRLVCSTCFQ